MEIVDGEQHRSVRGDPSDEPEQRMQRGEVVTSPGRDGRWPVEDQPPRPGGGIAQQLTLMVGRGSGDERLQQLAHHPERQLLLQL